MSRDDPFSESDGKTRVVDWSASGEQKRRTTTDDATRVIVRPTPGGRGRRTEPVQSPPFAGPDPGPIDMSVPAGFQIGSGALAAAAFPLLMVVPKLRGMAFHNAPGELRERLTAEIKNFHTRSLEQGFSENEVKIASYFLCSLIDEAVLNTPWGSGSDWGHDSLLVRFHKEAVGGEEFFLILDKLLQRPAQHPDLLELAYLCLSLGLEGKYRFGADGLRSLENLRLEVYLQLQKVRNNRDTSLSVHWQGMRDLRSPLTRHVPLWVLGGVAGICLLAAYLGFSYAVNTASDRVYGQWAAIASEEARMVPEPQWTPPVEQMAEAPEPPPILPPVEEPAEPGWAERFRELLAPEIERKMVEVLDPPILRITQAFASGSDQVKDDFLPMLIKIARELQDCTSHIEVIGHTDSQPIFTARFPSNWHLSTARAQRVADILEASGAPGERVTHKGRAENDPVAPNDTPENRALNRRIDIHIR